MNSLYDADILEWSEHQAELLRRVAAGEVPNVPPDWPNIIEEVADVGLNSLRACRSLLLQALLHDLKAAAWPLARDVAHWRAEARRFRIDAADAFAPSMKQRIDVQDIYAKARRAMPDAVDGQPPLPVPVDCPVTLEALLAED
jgi:hypothetical protein